MDLQGLLEILLYSQQEENSFAPSADFTTIFEINIILAEHTTTGPKNNGWKRYLSKQTMFFLACYVLSSRTPSNASKVFSPTQTFYEIFETCGTWSKQTRLFLCHFGLCTYFSKLVCNFWAAGKPHWAKNRHKLTYFKQEKSLYWRKPVEF